MKRHCLILVATLATFAGLGTFTRAAEPQPLRLALARHAQVSSSLEDLESPIPVGLVLDVTRTEGEWLWVGRGWVQLGDVIDVADAVEHFSREIEASPSAFALVSRARAHLQNGDSNAAAADCTAALELDAEYAPAHCQLGRALHEQRKYNLAIEAFDRALEFDIRSVLAYCYRGQTLQAMNDPVGAMANFDCAIELDARLTPAYFVRGCLHSKQGNDESAAADFTSVVLLNPNHSPAYNNRANLATKLGYWKQAVDDYTVALRLTPRADVLVNRAHALRNLGRLDAALADCNEAIRVEPDAPAAYRMRAALHVEQGRTAEAEQDERQAELLASNRET